ANARLAVKLTGWNIDIKEETIAKQEGIEYLSVDELVQKAHDKQRMEAYQRYIDSIRPTEKDVLPVAKEEVSEVKEKVAVEPVVAPAVEEVVEQPVKVTNIKITTDLETLERELESQKEKNKAKPVRAKRPRKISDDEVKDENKEQKPYTAPEPENKPYMQIYSEEELAEIEKEAEQHTETFVEEEIDYDEYDEYYDDEE
ncbi:MAG: hypothetical protein WC014_03455, partial [Bacilli bacterium]